MASGRHTRGKVRGKNTQGHPHQVGNDIPRVARPVREQGPLDELTHRSVQGDDRDDRPAGQAGQQGKEHGQAEDGRVDELVEVRERCRSPT